MNGEFIKELADIRDCTDEFDCIGHLYALLMTNREFLGYTSEEIKENIRKEFGGLVLAAKDASYRR